MQGHLNIKYENKVLVNKTDYRDKRGISWASEQLPAVFRVIMECCLIKQNRYLFDRTVKTFTDI
jgi:hypothetical protein